MPIQYAGKKWTDRIMHEVKPYFLAPYKEGRSKDQKITQINGSSYTVERYNHGLAHGLRQGALAKDIVQLLARLKKEGHVFGYQESNDLLAWVREKITGTNPNNFIKKIEMAAAFQRSGRQSECSSAADLDKYKKYEMQDTVNFRSAASKSKLFAKDREIPLQVFEEAILWSNKGTLDENVNRDLKYIRRILHAAHTLDLRRIPKFDGKRIKQDALNQLFGSTVNVPMTGGYKRITKSLWKRSGTYLHATGDRDLVHGRKELHDKFFLQSNHPSKMVKAIHRVTKEAIK